jgi:hypothetical protein
MMTFRQGNDDDHVEGVTLHLLTVAINGPIVHHSGDRAWRTMVE